jgi:hypothetical protein
MTKRKTFAAATQAPQGDDDPIPDNIDDFRNALARRINKFIGDRARRWRDCPEKCCRRARHCIAPRGRCANRPPAPPSTPEDTARVIAEVTRAMRARLAQSEGGKAAREGKR